MHFGYVLGLSSVHYFIRSNHHGKYTAWPHLRISCKYLTAVVMQYSSQKPKQEFTFSILRLPRLSSRTIAPLASPFIHVTCLSQGRNCAVKCGVNRLLAGVLSIELPRKCFISIGIRDFCTSSVQATTRKCFLGQI